MVVPGTDIMKQYPICIFHQSQNLITEFDQYAWKKHRDGTPLNVPEDKYNHLIDAARYWVIDECMGHSQSARKFQHLRKVVSGGKRKRY
jgi:phage terminase large subunit